MSQQVNGTTFNSIQSKKVFEDILKVDEDHHSDIISYRQDGRRECQLACRDLNTFIRKQYANFRFHVGNNIYPLIIATDHEDGFSGVGSTFTLYLEDGRQMKMTPSLWSNYEIYKSVTHISLGISVIIGPFLKNQTSSAWHQPMHQFLQHLYLTKDAIEASTDRDLDKQVVGSIVESGIAFCKNSLTKKTFTCGEWKVFNEINFTSIKKCMKLATKIQAEKCVEELLKWKEMLGPIHWRKLYVVIPSVWPVNSSNPRLEIFRNLMDTDRLNTNIIHSENPRNAVEARDLLGRILGDRAIARFVFGTQTQDQKNKVVYYSSGVDVLQDDANPNIRAALVKRGVKPLPFLKVNQNIAEQDSCRGSLVGTSSIEELNSSFEELNMPPSGSGDSQRGSQDGGGSAYGACPLI